MYFPAKVLPSSSASLLLPIILYQGSLSVWETLLIAYSMVIYSSFTFLIKC